MKKITVLDIKFFPHTVRWYRRKKSKQDSTQVSCFDGFAHIETTDGMRTAHVRVICDPMEKPDKICTVHMARAYDVSQLSAQDVQMAAYECVLKEMQQYISAELHHLIGGLQALLLWSVIKFVERPADGLFIRRQRTFLGVGFFGRQ